ncbi:MAG TPA: Na+/H+ antiporter [Rubrobacteraceae bacterium]|nr:Na+/H+ antiporter [Rubrobacteraceae bacterium]
MTQIESLIFLLGVAALLTLLAQKVKVPYPVFLVLGGLGIGFVPGLPTVEIPPEVIFLVFLPPLLSAEAFFSSPLDLRRRFTPLLAITIGLVFLTAAAIAVVAHTVVGLPWAAAFVLGAILAPTDPVAAGAVFRRLGVPRQVSTIVEGESLINDGSALAVYRVAIAAVVTGTFSVWEAGLNFLWVGGGGIVVGLVLARVLLPLWARVRDTSIFIALSLLTAYVVYIAAENLLGVSGILAVVSYGLYRGWRDPRLFPDASTRMQNISFWQVLVFLLESLLFVLVGQQLPAILTGLQGYRVVEVLLYAALIYGVLVGTRFAWFLTTPSLHPAFDRLLRGQYLYAPWQERLVMSWSGMRGAVSLAAALAIPFATGAGDPFPGRDLIIFLTFSAILGTLVLQGLTLEPLIRALRLESDEQADTQAELKARLEGARAALSRLEQLCTDERVPPGAQQRMRGDYEERIRRYASGLEAGGTTQEYVESSVAWRSWRHELLIAEREAVASMRDRGEISPEVMRRIMRDLDLEESRIGG